MKWCQVFARHECIGAQTELAWVRKSHEDAAADTRSISTKRGKQ